MDYTQAPDSVVDAGTGHKLHTDTAAIPTEVTAKDINMLIWELMEVLNAAGIGGVQFDPAIPASYKKVLTALQVLFLGGKVNSWNMDAEGNRRLYFDRPGAHSGTSYVMGYGDTLFAVTDVSGNKFFVSADGQCWSAADATGPNNLPRLSQVAGLITAAFPGMETTASDSSYASISATHAASPQWVKGALAAKTLGSSRSQPGASNGTWFTNSAGHPIQIHVVAGVGNASSSGGTVYAATTSQDYGGVIGISNDASSTGSFTFTVLPGDQWRVSWGSPVSYVNTFILG